MGPEAALPPEAYAAALASVPGVGPRALRTLLAESAPRAAWGALLEGRVPLRPEPGSRTSPSEAARRIDVAAVWAAHVSAGVRVALRGGAGYPEHLARDAAAPAVLFFLGDCAVLDACARVAIVGTRSATRYGLGVAAALAADLAGAGVVVVSGLALGIDGAAHEGAVAAWHASLRADAVTEPDDGARAPRAQPLGAPPVAVVAGSLDRPYPRQHAGLWRRVADAGAVLSEAPLGAADLGWRFPMRNRIIAALADVVVVVECHTRGGSFHTVHAANARGVPVGAVPGSVRSPASSGTNALLADGCFVVRDASDVLAALSLVHASARGLRVVPRLSRSSSASSSSSAGAGAAAGSGASSSSSSSAAVEVASPAEERGARTPVLDVLGWERCDLDDVVRRSGIALDAVCAVLERLRAEGLVHGEAGWWERV